MLERLLGRLLWVAAMTCPDDRWFSLDPVMRVRALADLESAGGL